MGRGSPVPVQMWAEGGPSRGADVTRVGPVPVQTWQRRAQPIPVQMWPNERALARQYVLACTFPGPLPWPFLPFFPLPRPPPPPPPKADGPPTSVICEAVPLDLGTASRAARRSVSVRNPSADVACAAAVSAQPRGGREAVPPTSCVCVCPRARVHAHARQPMCPV